MTMIRNNPTLTAQFEATTVDVDELTRYLYRMPRYLEAGVHVGASQQALDYLAYTDSIDFWLRRYLATTSKTLRIVFAEIRLFMAYDERAARGMTDYILKAIHDAIIANEWFELMPRYQIARKRIQKTFQI